MKVILFRSSKNGKTQDFEFWTLPAKGDFPEREMVGLTYYDLDRECVDKLNVPNDEWQEVDFSEFSDFSVDAFAHWGSQSFPVVELTFESVRKGRYTVDTLKKISPVV